MDDMPFYTGQMSRSEMVRRLRHADMPAKLGSKALYNNCMYAVAGEVAAKITGQSYEDVVRSKVIIPLGLDNTGLSAKEMESRSDNHATPMVAASLEDAQKGFSSQSHRMTTLHCWRRLQGIFIPMSWTW